MAKRLSSNLWNSTMNGYSRDALIDTSESIIDSATKTVINNKLLEDIPVLKYVLGGANAVKSFRERRYLNKLLRFLAETSDASEKEILDFKQKLDANPEKAQHAGELILDTVDKVTSEKKAMYIGKVVRASMGRKDFTLDDVILMVEIIERIHISQLEVMENGGIEDVGHLQAVGVVEQIKPEDISQYIANAMKRYEETTGNKDNLRLRGITPAPMQYERFQESAYTEIGIKLFQILKNVY